MTTITTTDTTPATVTERNRTFDRAWLYLRIAATWRQLGNRYIADAYQATAYQMLAGRKE